MFERILLIPGSGGADQPAVRRALSLAATDAAAEIEVFDPVYEPLLEGYYGDKQIYEPLRRRLLDERLGSAQQLAAELEQRGCQASATVVWDHPLDRATARRVVDRDHDLVVTQSLEGHRGALSHADWRLVSMCPVPVLFVKTDGKAAYRRVVAAVDPLHAHAKPAELDDAILECAKALRTRFGAQLDVVHCYVPLAQLAGAAQLPLDDTERALEQTRQQALEQLVDKAGLPRSATKVVPGRPETVLGETVGEADLLIMGALSRGRLKDFLIGSTAERVLQRGRADVLLVKPPGMSFAL